MVCGSLTTTLREAIRRALSSARLAHRQAQTGQQQLAVLGVAPLQFGRNDQRGNGAQLYYDGSCFVEPSHMRVARGEKAVRVGKAWIVLDRQEELRCRFV